MLKTSLAPVLWWIHKVLFWIMLPCILFFPLVTPPLALMCLLTMGAKEYVRKNIPGDNRFAGKVMWITGASSGIGEALAKEAYREGAALILSARRGSELERVKTECQGLPQGTGRIEVLEYDALKPEKLDELVEQAYKLFPVIDYVVLNAGQSFFGYIVDTSMDVVRHMMELNYFAVVDLGTRVVKKMLKIKSGHVVITGSVAGVIGGPLRAPYSGAKHAIHGWAESLQAEVADSGLQVSVVMPGPVNTPIPLARLSADGSQAKKQTKFHSEAMSAQQAAVVILDGIAQKEFIIPVGLNLAVLGTYIHRILPEFTRYLSRKLKVGQN